MKRTMVNEDEPDHMARRRLLMDAFMPERLIAYEPIVRQMARQYMDRFVDAGRADLVGAMFYEIPRTIALKFLGVPDEGAEQLRRFAVAHTLNTWGRPTPAEQIEIAHNVGRFWQTAQEIRHHDGPARRRRLDVREIRRRRHPDIVESPALDDDGHPGGRARTTSNATANAS